MDQEKKILVIGSGAVGSFYGAILRRAGCAVTFWIRSHSKMILKSGLTIQSPLFEMHIPSDCLLTDVSAYQDTPDYILIATKVLPEIKVDQLIKPVIGKNSVIVLIQNGIDIEASLQAAYPNHQVISSLAFIYVTRTQIGHVQHHGNGQLSMGRYPEGASLAVKTLSGLFEKGGIDCSVTDHCQRDRWKKLVWNAAFNPISVITGYQTDKILSTDQTRAQLIAVMKEVCLVAEKKDIELPDNIIEKMIQTTEKMAPYKTSMLVDFEENRPIEHEAILGRLITHAERLDCSVPSIKSLYHELLACIQRRSCGQKKT